MQTGQIFNAMVAFFEEDDWVFNWIEGKPILSVPFTGKSARWMCYAQAREQQQQFVFYSVCPINAPSARRAEAVEFITRANYGMIIGNFELDYNDGEIRYKTSIDVENAALTSPLVKQLVYSNVAMMDRYLPGIMSVIYGGTDPAEAVRIIETPQETHDAGMEKSANGSGANDDATISDSDYDDDDYPAGDDYDADDYDDLDDLDDDEDDDVFSDDDFDLDDPSGSGGYLN